MFNPFVLSFACVGERPQPARRGLIWIPCAVARMPGQILVLIVRSLVRGVAAARTGLYIALVRSAPTLPGLGFLSGHNLGMSGQSGHHLPVAL